MLAGSCVAAEPGPAQDHLLVHGGAVRDFIGCLLVEFRLLSKKKKGTKLHQEITEEITMKYISAAQLSYIWISMASGPTERLQVIQLTVMVAEM